MNKDSVWYVAFLRGINVGGKKIIKMELLQKLFEEAGCSEVKTLIQSGNVIFNAKENDILKMRKKIESHLEARLGFAVETMLRTQEELRSMVERDPFGGLVEDAEKKLYVSILHDLPAAKLDLPYIDEKEGIEVIEITGEDAFIISRRIANGRYGFPNIVIEKKLKVAATTRNWNTLKKLV